MATDTVYISYAYYDKYFADKLYQDLTNAGIKVVWDGNLLRTGSNWVATLENAIRNATALVVLMSPLSAQSDSVKNEVQLALDNGLRIFPVLVHGEYDAVAANFPRGILDYFARTILTSKDYEQVVQDLILELQPSQQQILDMLRDEDLGDGFVSMIERLMQMKLDDSHIFIHYHRTLSLSEALEIENVLNDVFRSIVNRIIFADKQAKAFLDNSPRLLVVESFTHPGSSDLLIAIVTAVVTTALNSREVREFVMGLLINAVYDVLKKGASETRDYIFAARKNGEEDEEWHLGEPESPIENNGLPEFHDELESVFDDEFYVGVGGFDLIIARRSRRTTRRRVK